MTITPSYIPGPAQTDPQAQARATALGIGIAPRTVPPVYAPFVTSLPGVVAEFGTVVFVHDDGTLTSGQVTTAIAPLVAAQAAQQTATVNLQTVLANLATRQAQLDAFITANPNGAILTAAQVNILARMLNCIFSVLQGIVSNVNNT